MPYCFSRGVVSACDGDGCSEFHHIEEFWGEMFWEADASCGCGHSRAGNVSAVETDPVIGEAHPVGHGSGHEFCAARDRFVEADAWVDDFAEIVFMPSPSVGYFVCG